MASGTRTPLPVNVTASGNTTLVAAPGVGFSLSILSLTGSVNNSSTLTFREGIAGTIAFVVDSSKVSSFEEKFIVPWKIATNTALVVNCSLAPAAWVNVQYYVSVT